MWICIRRHVNLWTAGRRRAHIADMIGNLILPEGQEPSATARAAGFVAALLMVTFATMAGLLMPPAWGNAPIVLLYLPPVLVSAIFSGRFAAIAAATVSTLAFNFYFTAPYQTFVIHSAADIVTVAVLFLVALVTSHLASSLRRQARLAARHAARNATIAGFARRLLSCNSRDAIADVAVTQLSSLFSCHAVLAISHDDVEIVASEPAGEILAPNDLAAAALTLKTCEISGRGVGRGNAADWQFHPIASNDSAIAAVGLAREDGQPALPESQKLLLANLLDQVALALERARLDQEARDAASMRERDGIRSALLASIGDDIKPRLNTIGAVVRALKRAGSSDPKLLASAAAETAKLDRYVDNLVDLSPGGEQEPIMIGTLSIDLHRRSVHQAGEKVHLTPKEYALLAELAKHTGRVLTHAQLLRTIWGPAHEGHIDYLRVAVRSLRQKLEGDPTEPQLIINEPAVGYRLAFNASR